MTVPVTTAHLAAMMQDARSRTLELVSGLSDDQLMGPKIRTVNPLRWEIGHVAYFYEYFILRELYGRDSLLGPKADELYDSISIAHDTRWDLPLLSLDDTLAYMQGVFDVLIERLGDISDDNFASEQEFYLSIRRLSRRHAHRSFPLGPPDFGLPNPHTDRRRRCVRRTKRRTAPRICQYPWRYLHAGRTEISTLPVRQ